jgi:MYXO-CTERM domain-containing protein
VENPSLQAYLDVPGDALARTSLHPGDTGAFPDDAQLHRGEVVHVLADHPVDLAVVLTHPAHDAPVAWNPAAALLDIRTSGGENAPYVWRPEGVLSLTLPANREVTVTVSWQGVSIPAGRVRAVEAESLTELEVVVGYLPPERDGGSHRVPIGARAILRLADGTPVYGAPVQWSVARGSFALWRDEDEAWGPDYVALMDEHGQGCHAPATETRTYEGTVVAEFGDLMGTVRIAWEEPGGGLSGLFEGREYEPSALCVGPGFESSGCGCHSGEGSRASWMALLLLGLGFTCRSRR